MIDRHHEGQVNQVEDHAILVLAAKTHLFLAKQPLNRVYLGIDCSEILSQINSESEFGGHACPRFVLSRLSTNSLFLMHVRLFNAFTLP